MSSLRRVRDAAIAADIQDSLANHVLLRHLAIELSVRGGVAHIRGRAGSLEERDRLRQAIGRVRGVNAVWDMLRLSDDAALRVLDIGCGNRKQQDEAIGVDRHRSPVVDVVAHLERGLPFTDDSIDRVYAVHFLEHVTDLLQMMNEVHRVLKPDGVLHVMVPNAQCVNAIADPTHRRFFNRQTFKFFCRPYPDLRLFRPLGVSATDEDLYADLQPVKNGSVDNPERVLARFFD